ncbi:MAG: hypothetical protein IIY70_04515 [Oscillospiraceae bacterium]|nr:hypothetical protein [Oscillospiraceae bacterium]
MSLLSYFAADIPLPERVNPHDLADDEELVLELDAGEFQNGDYDDDFSIHDCSGMDSIFSEKPYCAALYWSYSEGRAEQVLAYLRNLLVRTEEVELWHIWMGTGEPPLIRSTSIPISQLRAEDLRILEDRDVREEFYGIPIQYRLVIQKDGPQAVK